MLEYIENRDYDSLLFFIAIRIGVVLVCWIFMAISNIVDFWSGTTTAKALGEKLDSRGFRRTITKIGDYVRLMLFALMFDILGSFLDFYVLPFATILCTIAILFIEGRSVVENSRRKKAHAADVPDVVKQIVQCATTEHGLELLNKITKELKEDKSNGTES